MTVFYHIVDHGVISLWKISQGQLWVKETKRQHVSLKLLILVSLFVLFDNHMGSQVMEQAMFEIMFSVLFLLRVKISLCLFCFLVSLDLIFEAFKLASFVLTDRRVIWALSTFIFAYFLNTKLVFKHYLRVFIVLFRVSISDELFVQSSFLLQNGFPCKQYRLKFWFHLLSPCIIWVLLNKLV